MFGRPIEPQTWRRLAKNTLAGLWDLPVLPAAALTALIWAAIWNGFLATAFWPGMPGADPRLARLHLWLGLGIGLAWGALAGWWSLCYFNRPADRRAAQAALSRLLGLQRLHSAALAGFFALAAAVQAWAIDRRFGAATLAVLGLEIAGGFYFLPVLLRYLAGEHPRLWRLASRIERGALLGIGALAALNPFAPLLLGRSNHFLSVLLHMLCLILLPWTPALLAWAQIYLRNARD